MRLFKRPSDCLSASLFKGHSRESGRTGGRGDEKMTMTMTYMYTETRRHRVFFIAQNYIPSVSDTFLMFTKVCSLKSSK